MSGALHLLKLSVGTEDVPGMARNQAARLAEARRQGEPAELRHVTRHRPRRAEELLDGGSIYWVIKGVIRARQLITELKSFDHPERGTCCAIILDHQLVETRPRPFRAFQGWRYLKPSDAPEDLPEGAVADDLPAEMESELRALGLL